MDMFDVHDMTDEDREDIRDILEDILGEGVDDEEIQLAMEEIEFLNEHYEEEF